MKTKLLLFPLGGNSLEALDCLDDSYEVIGFVDDDPKKIGGMYLHLPIFDRSGFSRHTDAKVLACIGNATNFKKRAEIIEGLQLPLDRFATVIHPNAHISKYATLGTNCLIMAGVVVTHNASIGNSVMILPNTVIHHDTSIGDYTSIGSSVVIAGFTKIGNSCYIGSGSTIINNVEIGDQTLVGLGTNVVKSFGSKKKVVGNPAKEIE